MTDKEKQELEKEIFNLLQDEEFEDACLCDPDTSFSCYQWNISASYCMKKSVAKCPKVIKILSLLSPKPVKVSREKVGERLFDLYSIGMKDWKCTAKLKWLNHADQILAKIKELNPGIKFEEV